MKKITNITLGKRIFAIEIAAHDELETYLKSIETRFARDNDKDEIASDIETAIAEKLTAIGRGSDSAITREDIEVIVKEMGTAEEVVGEAEEQPTAATTIKRKLYRDSEDKIIGGVASGIAQYLGVDPVWVRLFFVLAVLTFVGSILIPIYLLLWLFIPLASTTAERFSMRGSRVTLDELKSQVKEMVGNETTNSGIERLTAVLKRVFLWLGTVLRSVWAVAKYVVAALLFLGGLLGAVGLICMYLIFWLADKAWLADGMRIPLEQALSTPLGFAFFLASFLVFFIPALVAILIGALILFKSRMLGAGKLLLLGSIWLVALVASITASALYLDRYGTEIKDYIGPQIYEFADWRERDIDYHKPF